LKKTIAISAILLMAFIIVGAEDQIRTLAVTGTAEVSVSPDICYMSFVVETEHTNAAQAYKDNNQLMNTVSASIKQAGIPGKDMQTVSFSIYPQYHYEDKTNKQIFDGYLVSHTLYVKVFDLDKVSDILDAAVNAGITRVNNINFTVENPKKYLEDARIEALKAARKKAEIIASETGVKLGKPISITEAEPGSYYYNYYAQANVDLEPLYRDGGGAALESGEIKLTHTVYITYEIE
jgi:uncharacterized protein YggE